MPRFGTGTDCPRSRLNALPYADDVPREIQIGFSERESLADPQPMVYGELQKALSSAAQKYAATQCFCVGNNRGGRTAATGF